MTSPEHSKPSYITNGSPYTRVTFIADSAPVEQDGRVAIVDGYAEKAIELKDLQERDHRVGEATIQAALLSADNPSGELKILMMGWGGNYNAPIARLELAEVARANRNQDSGAAPDILVVNNPGSGESSTLPKAVMSEMIKTGSFMPYGELVATALKGYLQNYDTLSLSGHSFGARSVIATAAHLDKNSKHVTVNDPPGSRHLGVIGLANGFLRAEAAHAGQYMDHSDNEVSKQLQRENDSIKMLIKNMGALGPNGLQQQFVSQTRAMSKSGLAADLTELAQSNKTQLFQIATPEFSELTRPEDVTNILQALANTYPHLTLRQLILLGQTHSVTGAGNAHMVGFLSRPR